MLYTFEISSSRVSDPPTPLQRDTTLSEDTSHILTWKLAMSVNYK